MPIRQIPPSLTQTWIFISFADQLKPANTLSLHLMDRDLVLWKSAAGVISLQDAYCPHMGAHLGQGKIRGELLECVFHKRSFNSNGECQGRGLNNKNYPVMVIQNLIFGWFGSTAPEWKMPDFLTGFSDGSQSKWRILKSKKLNFDFHPKDLLDNTVDASHFKTFHNQCTSFMPVQILESLPHQFISRMIFLGSPQLKLKNTEMELQVVSESYGPATLVVNSSVIVLKQKYFFKFIFLCTPIDNENTDYTLAIAVRADSPVSFGRKILEYLYNQYAFHMQVKEFRKESNQIWKHKTYLPAPDLNSQENAMLAYSKWYSQFYVGA